MKNFFRRFFRLVVVGAFLTYCWFAYEQIEKRVSKDLKENINTLTQKIDTLTKENESLESRLNDQGSPESTTDEQSAGVNDVSN